jgi:hypothetical protein
VQLQMDVSPQVDETMMDTAITTDTIITTTTTTTAEQQLVEALSAAAAAASSVTTASAGVVLEPPKPIPAVSEPQLHPQTQPAVPLLYRCYWKLSVDLQVSESIPDLAEIDCGVSFSSEKELLAHISGCHLHPSEDGTEAEAAYICRWKECQQLDSKPRTRAKTLAHVSTHTGLPVKEKHSFNAPSARSNVPHSKHSEIVMELAGIPLTSLLILRNIARVAKHRDIFLAAEADLVRIMAEKPTFSKMVGEILWELR